MNFKGDNSSKKTYEISLNEPQTPKHNLTEKKQERKEFLRDENLKGEKKAPQKADFEGNENISNLNEQKAKLFAHTPPQKQEQKAQKEMRKENKKQERKNITLASNDLKNYFSEFTNKKPSEEVNDANKDSSNSSEQNETKANKITPISPQDFIRRHMTEGSDNLLNTRESKYFNFFKRLVDTIDQIWQSDVTNYARTAGRFSGQYFKSEYYTSLYVTLDPNGVVTNIEINQPCGLESFDKLAVKAFKDAYNFPNPPKSLIEQDGQIHIQFGFLIR